MKYTATYDSAVEMVAVPLVNTDLTKPASLWHQPSLILNKSLEDWPIDRKRNPVVAMLDVVLPRVKSAREGWI